MNDKTIIDMTQSEIEAFQAIAPLLIPELFDVNFMRETEDFGDYAMITFVLAKPLAIDTVMDLLEDQMELNILYHILLRSAGSECQQCCAYSNPTFEHMYKVNAQSDGTGLVDTVYVNIYPSLEVMLESLKEDLELHSSVGEKITLMTLPALISDFM